MEWLLHLFQNVFISPALTLLIGLYQLTHNFGLAIILQAILVEVCLYWPVNYIAASGRKMILTAEALGLYSYNINPFSTLVMFLLNVLAWYLLCSLYLTLGLLGGWSLSTLNNLLLSIAPKLTALPNYEFPFLGQTISVVQRGFFLGVIPFVILISFLIAYVNVERVVRDRKDEGARHRLRSVFIQQCFFYIIFVVGLSLLFAAGAGLYWTTSMILFALFRLFLTRRNLA